MKKQRYVSPTVLVIAIRHAETLMTGSIVRTKEKNLQSNVDPNEVWDDVWGDIDEAE